ncbi:hypothetical protein GCG54_00002675 [Colletotrichum gloeosporioides]|uniref:Uncharacterized protein n=1 Tax=Colletotrichum gloeosporioides TaxID=474922 RepID=A0A8H4CU75_COLGL|nr:uncharacterized protein GCG54_00002675 [Colletotrichum gloeosporioides]KAF3810220.1 hypothetical protein GCG54_00002675 [Colletotrichum gloeosporioides]
MTGSLPRGSSSSHSLLSDGSSRVSPSTDGPPSARRKKDGMQQDLNIIGHHGKNGQHRPTGTNCQDDSGVVLDASEMEATNDVEELPFARPPKFKLRQFSGPQQRLPIHAEDFEGLEDLASLQDERPQKLKSISHQHQERSGRRHDGGRHRKDAEQSDGINTGVNAENGNDSPVHEVHSGRTTDASKDHPNIESQISLVDKSLQYEKSYNELAADSQQRAAQIRHQENRLNRVLEQRDHLRAETSKMRAELESSRIKQSELQEHVIRAEAEIEKEAGRNRKHREEASKQTEFELMALKEEQKVTIDGLKAQLEAKRDAYENEKRALKDLQVDFATLKEHMSGAEAKAKGLDNQLTEIKQSNDRFQKIEAIMAKIFTGIENLAEKSDKADVVPPQIVKKLDEIAGFAQRASREDNDGTRKALDAFQEQLTSKIGEKIVNMTKGQNIIQGKMQSLEECLKSQSSHVEAEQKKQQEQQQQQITEKSAENARLAQNLDTKDKQVTELTKAVSEMGQRLQRFEEALDLVAQGAASETELQAAQESLNTSETRVNQLRAELQSQRAAYESEKTDLGKQLEKAKDDLKKTEDLLKTSAEKAASAEREFNAASDEKQRELEETVKKEQQAHQKLKQKHDELFAEQARLQEESAETSKREKEKLERAEKDLKVAEQRITNLTMKIRETQTTSSTANPNDLTHQQLEDQLKMVRECHRLMEEMQPGGKDLFKGKSGAPEPSNSLRDDEQHSHASTEQQHSGAPGNADASNNDEEPELPEVPCTDPINWKDILEISSSSSDGILEEDSQQKSVDTLEEDLQRKRILINSPVEAADTELAAPSVSQERAQRHNSTSQGSQPKSILRPGSSYTPTAASTNTAESARERALSTHSGHTEYNRPVGSRDTISYAKFSSFKSRKLPRPQLLDFRREHKGNKRVRTEPPLDRQTKRIKHVSDPRDRDDVFTDRLENAGQPSGGSALERSTRASTEALSIESQDNSSMSRHFQTGTSAKNDHQPQSRLPLAGKTPQSSQDGPSSTGRRNITRTYSKLPVKT